MVVAHNTPRRENLADCRDGHSDSGTRFSLTYSAGPSAAQLGPADVLCWSERAPVAAASAAADAAGAAAEYSFPLLRLRAAQAVHEPLAMIDSQCNVHTAICVQYQVGATAAQAGSDKETLISKNTKFDIEAQSFNIVYKYRT
jgi:hypothetical protein